MKARLRDKLLYGVLAPVVLLVISMLFLANVDSRAGAAEFAGLGVFFMLLAALPFTLVVNGLALWAELPSKRVCFFRGLVFPALVVLAGIVYQSGLWDRWT